MRGLILSYVFLTSKIVHGLIGDVDKFRQSIGSG